MRSTSFASLFLFSSLTSAAGLYSKTSNVLEVDGKTYDKLIAKSNYTSILEFYAPWCGHCKNLKPAYEKAATSLAGVAKVAAVNCDEDSNKPFCGQMGIKGFPTLKLVKPSKKGGKPIVQDYSGERTAKAIHEYVTDKIPNHVTRPKDDDIDDFLKQNDRPKALFFTEKRVIGSMVKALAIDFLGAVDVAQVTATQQKGIVSKFLVDRVPSFYLMQGPDTAPEKYEGEMKKQPLKDFISKYATPNPEFPPTIKPKAKAKPSDAKKASKESPKAAKKEASDDDEEIAECPAGHGKGKNPHKTASQSVEEEPASTPSPQSKDAEESPAPKVDIGPAPALQSLDNVEALSKHALNTRVGTCLLALLPPKGDDKDTSALKGLMEISHKHVSRKSKLFPFYSVPSSNEAAQGLAAVFGADPPDDKSPLLLVFNMKKGWWTQYPGTSMEQRDVETWVDNVRFGDFKKSKISDEVIEALTAAAPGPGAGKAKGGDEKHDEL